ncbi:hypothetical protein BO82DRAFT_101395 [Aspergillus uvarum CBS 121591]|uniref:Uncharacterized protein n=1 Tax=Aspergillus uvarum CBS 121591 TaxID=1448315 RepID=A0A319DMW8_9EURO|nr:hypothetical protein BO82DRAFT_101395 [Aspergillus uvarum CBS 121591]PYH80692.1 hypothetical protein BO82DRAFT_101395 [Aspergillus uvarum CBS 121591]
MSGQGSIAVLIGLHTHRVTLSAGSDAIVCGESQTHSHEHSSLRSLCNTWTLSTVSFIERQSPLSLAKQSYTLVIPICITASTLPRQTDRTSLVTYTGGSIDITALKIALALALYWVA